MAIFGSPTGRIYCLGKIVVTTPGTSVLLNLNVPLTTGFGTSANPTTVIANQIIFKAAKVNQGVTYLCFKGGNKNTPNSIIWDFSPDGSFTLGTSMDDSPYQPSVLAIDADTMNDGVFVTCIMGT